MRERRSGGRRHRASPFRVLYALALDHAAHSPGNPSGCSYVRGLVCSLRSCRRLCAWGEAWADESLMGLYHITAGGSTTWCRFVGSTVEKNVTAISSGAY